MASRSYRAELALVSTECVLFSCGSFTSRHALSPLSPPCQAGGCLAVGHRSQIPCDGRRADNSWRVSFARRVPAFFPSAAREDDCGLPRCDLSASRRRGVFWRLPAASSGGRRCPVFWRLPAAIAAGRRLREFWRIPAAIAGGHRRL